MNPRAGAIKRPPRFATTVQMRCEQMRCEQMRREQMRRTQMMCRPSEGS
jgi:hypothetical protein